MKQLQKTLKKTTINKLEELGRCTIPELEKFNFRRRDEDKSFRDDIMDEVLLGTDNGLIVANGQTFRWPRGELIEM